jgi:putative membrane protein
MRWLVSRSEWESGQQDKGNCRFLLHYVKKPPIMQTLSTILVALVALEHLYILYIEMFAWETKGKETFKGSLAPELFKPTKTLAANQGLYNGFLAAGLIWSLLIEDHHWRLYVGVFFLTCVIVAGIYGAVTASKKIFFVQALPAIVALVVLHL